MNNENNNIININEMINVLLMCENNDKILLMCV